MPLPLPIRVESERVQTRPLDAADIEDLLLANGDDEVTRFLPYASWRSVDDGMAWLERMQKLESAGTGTQLVVVERASGKAIGTCLLFRYEEASARAELGYVLARRCWGRGYLLEALSALISQLFGSRALRRLEAEVNPDNVASCRLLEHLGFQNEGLLRQRWTGKGASYDTRFYGLLADEWPAAPEPRAAVRHAAQR
ncbi:MAG: GNAT family N-acetyltransferase [Burkholderiaceae bacterium]